MTGYNLEPLVASETAVMDAIERCYGAADSQQIQEQLDILVEAETSDAVAEADLERPRISWKQNLSIKPSWSFTSNPDRRDAQSRSSKS